MSRRSRKVWVRATGFVLAGVAGVSAIAALVIAMIFGTEDQWQWHDTVFISSLGGVALGMIIAWVADDLMFEDTMGEIHEIHKLTKEREITHDEYMMLKARLDMLKRKLND